VKPHRKRGRPRKALGVQPALAAEPIVAAQTALEAEPVAASEPAPGTLQGQNDDAGEEIDIDLSSSILDTTMDSTIFDLSHMRVDSKATEEEGKLI
jgi:hypothetical protein